MRKTGKQSGWLPINLSQNPSELSVGLGSLRPSPSIFQPATSLAQRWEQQTSFPGGESRRHRASRLPKHAEGTTPLNQSDDMLHDWAAFMGIYLCKMKHTVYFMVLSLQKLITHKSKTTAWWRGEGGSSSCGSWTHLLQGGCAQLDGNVLELPVPLRTEVTDHVGMFVRLPQQLYLAVGKAETLR